MIRPTESNVVTVDGVTWLQCYLVYETEHTRGKGYLRLKQEDGKYERAFTLFLTAWEIKGHEEVNLAHEKKRDSFKRTNRRDSGQAAFERRPNGAEIHNRDVPPEEKQTKTWLELRQEAQKFEDFDPTV